jgi:dephospho-CoA kinase
LLIEMTKGELDELHSPLAQFQAVETKKAGILFLVKSINLALETGQLSEGDLTMAFKRGWPVLSKQLNAVPHPPTQHRDLKSIVQAFDIMNERRDFTIMVRYFEDAQDAHICSGDYSWIKDNNDIQGKILELAAKKSIVLESYKTEKEIRDKLGDDLFEKLRMSLRFQNGRKIKCSLIRHSGSEVFLYRSTRVEDEKKIDRICVLTDGGEGRSLIDTLSTLISSKKRSVATIIMGLPASGKSTAAQYLSNFGYFVVSAGDFFRELCRLKGLQPTRDSCESVGQEFLRERGEDALADSLFERAGQAHRVVFDGIRPLRTATLMTHRYNDARIVYIEAPEDQRLNRARENPDDYRRLVERPMESQVVEAKHLFAQYVIVNDGPLEKLRHELRDVVLTQLASS